MASREGGDLVEKEQLCPGPWGHDLSSFSFVCKTAGDPGLQHVGGYDILIGVVDNAPVPEQRSTPGNGVKGTPGIDSILIRHVS